MILLWGLLEDPSMRAVHECLRKWNIETRFLNHAAVHRTLVRLTTEPDLSYEVSFDGQSFRLEEVSAAYLRPYNFRDYRPEPATITSNPAIVHHLISTWAEYTRALVISRPSAEGTNQSKLYQAAEISACGFLTPESLVTNQPDEIRKFQSTHGALIYKSMSSVRSIVQELRPEDLDGKQLGLVLFQRRIAGQNIRVHVAGDECFACLIETDGVDYRYTPSRFTPVQLPGEIADKARAVARKLGLVLAGLDLILTPQEEWYCLEANPNPAFACFDTSDEIAGAVARLLAAGQWRPGLG